MNEQQEIDQRAEVIAQVDEWIGKAREALDLRGWAERNGLDLEKVLAGARRSFNPGELAQVQREAEAQLNEIEQGLSASASAARPASAAPTSLRGRARL